MKPTTLAWKARFPIAVAAALLPAVPSVLQAQEADVWSVEGEIGATLFFGNTSQTTFTSRAAAAAADSTREFSSGLVFNYGEATDEGGDDFVNTRSWKATGSYDHHPLERWSVFVLGEVESSLERRIDSRYNLGGGAKYLIRSWPNGRVDLSGALLAERTNPADVAGVEAEGDLLARWSVRFRARRSWEDGRYGFNSETFYRPRADDPDDFTVSSTTSFSFQLSQVVSLKLTFVDNYDARAVDRGARTNNDGRFFFGVLSSF